MAPRNGDNASMLDGPACGGPVGRDDGAGGRGHAMTTTTLQIGWPSADGLIPVHTAGGLVRLHPAAVPAAGGPGSAFIRRPDGCDDKAHGIHVDPVDPARRSRGRGRDTRPQIAAVPDGFLANGRRRGGAGVSRTPRGVGLVPIRDVMSAPQDFGDASCFDVPAADWRVDAERAARVAAIPSDIAAAAAADADLGQGLLTLAGGQGYGAGDRRPRLDGPGLAARVGRYLLQLRGVRPSATSLDAAAADAAGTMAHAVRRWDKVRPGHWAAGPDGRPGRLVRYLWRAGWRAAFRSLTGDAGHGLAGRQADVAAALRAGVADVGLMADTLSGAAGVGDWATAAGGVRADAEVRLRRRAALAWIRAALTAAGIRSDARMRFLRLFAWILCGASFARAARAAGFATSESAAVSLHKSGVRQALAAAAATAGCADAAAADWDRASLRPAARRAVAWMRANPAAGAAGGRVVLDPRRPWGPPVASGAGMARAAAWHKAAAARAAAVSGIRFAAKRAAAAKGRQAAALADCLRGMFSVRSTGRSK